jgi:hypothetical protein
MKIGSDEHKERFCDEFIACHDPYDPSSLPWPDLDEDACRRLRAIPFWPEVLHTEQRAGAQSSRLTLQRSATRCGTARSCCRVLRRRAMPGCCS